MVSTVTPYGMDSMRTAAQCCASTYRRGHCEQALPACEVDQILASHR